MQIATKANLSQKEIRVLMSVVFVIAFILASQAAMAATTGVEFQAASTRFEGWVGGYYGKMVAFGATGIGILMSAIFKSFMYALSGLGIAIIVPVIMGVINASFTAII